MNPNQLKFIEAYNKSEYLQKVVNHFIFWTKFKSLDVSVNGCAITTLEDTLNEFGVIFEATFDEKYPGIFVTIK